MYEALAIVNVLSNVVEQGFRAVKHRLYGNSDIRTSNQVAPFGDDGNPIKGMAAVYAKTARIGRPVLLGYFNKSLLAGPGEKRIYSVDEDGEVSTFIWLTNDGKIQLGGDDDNAVRFSDLKEGFDELKSNFNDIVSAFNAHVHAGNGIPPTAVPGSIPASPSTASIDSSKIEEIQTP